MSLLLEKVLRHWLARQRSLIPGRFLLYEEAVNRRLTVHRCKELDAVAAGTTADDTAPRFVFEFKASQNLLCLQRGRGQLRVRRRVMNRQWRGVGCCQIVVNTGTRAMVSEPAELLTPDDKLNWDLLGRLQDGERIPLVVLPAETMLEYAKQVGFQFDQGLLASVRAYNESSRQERIRRKLRRRRRRRGKRRRSR